MNGWIKLYRKIWDSDLFKCRNKTDKIIVFIWLLTHCDSSGVVTAGRHQIARETGLSDQQVKRIVLYFDHKATNEVTIKPTNQHTIFTISNWGKYQTKPTTKPTSKPTSNRPATDQQPTTNKNKNKNKEYKEIHTDTVGLSVLQKYNEVFGKNMITAVPFSDNLDYWLTIYSLEDIYQAIETAKQDDYWRDKLTPVILFRRKNTQGEAVDWIGSLLERSQPASNAADEFIKSIT